MIKYLLCRPLGGLNDSLNRIYHCLEYCKKYNRTLLVDMKYNNGYSVNLSDYLEFTDPDIICDSDIIKKIIKQNNFTIFPNEISDLYNYKLDYNTNYSFNWLFAFEDKFISTEINLNIDYEEDIIVYNNCGGGNQSIEILKILKLSQKLVDEFYFRYNQIPKPYTSIHIRNTDYKLDYDSFFESNKSNIINNNIFLATDSKIVLDYFKNKNINYYNFTELPDNNQPIHSRFTQNNKSRVFIDTICDLLILALADKFILPKVYYGYTALALKLYNNKDIVKLILNL
jgi:hypothetical protein